MSAFLAGLLVAAAVLLLRPPPAGAPPRHAVSRAPVPAGPAPRRVPRRVPRRPFPVTAARPPVGRAVAPADLVVDLVAAAVEAGCAVPSACRAVADAVTEAAAVRGGTADHRLAEALADLAHGRACAAPELAGLERGLDRAARSGLAPSALVRRAADDARRDATARRAQALGRLPARLVLPAGLCLLPAAMLLGVGPVVLDLVSDLLTP